MQTKIEVVSLVHDFIDDCDKGQRKALSKYPGVTTILSKTKDAPGLDAWRLRVGDVEANRVLKESHAYGNSLDKMLTDCWDDGWNLDDHKDELGYRLFLQLKPHLKHVDPIALQLALWSDRLKVRGILDCLCFYKDKLTLLDFKNARHQKKPEYVEDYFLQCTMYSLMLYDLLGIKIEQIALFIGVRDSAFPQIFVRELKDYVKPAICRVSEYHRKHSPNS
jgi:hypothetical protein